MADVNYINPASILPQSGWKPQGFMGGMQYAQQMGDYEDQMSLSKLMSQIGAQGAIEEQVQGAPVRAAKRLSDIATANATTSTIGREKESLTSLNEDKARVSRAGVNDDIVTNHAKAIGEQGKLAMDQFQRQLQGSTQLAAIMQAAGPAGAAVAAQVAPSLGIDPNSAHFKALVTNPQAVIQHLNSVDAKLQGDLQKEREKDDAAFKRQQYASDSSAAASKYTADQAYNRAIEQAQIRAQMQQSQQRIEQVVTNYGKRIAAGETLAPAEIAHYEDARKMLYDLRTLQGQQNQAGAAALGLPEVPGVKPPPIPGQGAKFKVGDTTKVQGHSVQIVDVLPNGTYRVKDSTGKMGTWDGK